MHHIADRLREPQLHIYIGITRQRYQGIRVSLQCLSGVMSEGAVLATTVGGCSHHNTKRMYPKARVLYLPGQGQGSLAICRIPDDCIDYKRYPLFIARAVLKELIESLQSTQGVKPC